ncbi:MAG: BamA/TamA family outer membrane protein [Candidatus Sericytochromatia bacterium]|nr:BamA/TamA family outer membrane protein [Candidatus Tanganyikabacteria bacterium]
MPHFVAALASLALATATPSLEIQNLVVVGTPEPPEWTYSLVPIPLIYFGGGAELRHGGGVPDQYVLASGGYTWAGKEVYDPRSRSIVRSAAYATTNGGLSPYWDSRLGWGLNLTREVRVWLQGRYTAPALEANMASWVAGEEGKPLDNHYDPAALVGFRPIVTVGPHLQADYTDDPDFPTSGTWARVGMDYGPAWLGNQSKGGAANEFGLYRARLAQFFRVGEDMTVVVSGVAGTGTGLIPVNLRYAAGGATYVRGYLGDRFAGDRLLAGSIEWRHLALPGLVEYGDLGLGYHAYLDYGRVWETSCAACTPSNPAIAFPDDLRAGAGAGISVVAGRSTLLRLDLMAGNEGVIWYPLFGGLLKIPFVPGLGLSLRETW